MVTDLYFLDSPQELPPFEKSICIYDKKLEKILPAFSSLKKRFVALCPVQAGENLKDLKNFHRYLTQIQHKLNDKLLAKPIFIAMGGGSVGDFTSFVASVYKRGCPLIHIPTTWLAALDSAHGGKNALNLNYTKNQIGSFHYAESIWIVRDILEKQNHKEALGELAKIALIAGGRLWSLPQQRSQVDVEAFWHLLPFGIEAKYKIVQKDPEERKGIRRLLNLGHTLGHALEIQHGWPHGSAVGQGLFFSLHWSFKAGLMPFKTYRQCLEVLCNHFGLKDMTSTKSQISLRFTTKDFLRLMFADKKHDQDDELEFIFIQRPGKVLGKRIRLQRLLFEAHAQGWIK